MLNLFQHRISERPCDPETSSGRRKTISGCGSLSKVTCEMLDFFYQAELHQMKT